MARQLWLLRHAEAEPHGTRADSERRLTARGEAQARAAGIAIERLGGGFDAVLTSPKVRALRTAEIAAEQWRPDERDKLRTFEPLAGGFDARQALAAMREAAIEAEGAAGEASEHLLLIGHEPDLSGIVAGLGAGQVDLKKAGLAIVRLEGGSGELVVLLRPRDLALIAGVPLGGE